MVSLCDKLEKLFVDDPFCMFLKIRCTLDSYADVVFSRANTGEMSRLHVGLFLYF